MGLGARVEERRARALDAADHAELLEQLERRVDRRQRDAGQPCRDGVEQLVRGDVAIELAELLVHDDALRGNPHPTVAQRGC